MTAITERQKQELGDAIDQITAYCGSGMHPNQAIIKVAKQLDLAEDRLPILAHIYNIGATSSQWNANDTIRSKTAAFPLANVSEIKRELYPNGTTKTASLNVVPICDDTFNYSADCIFDNAFSDPVNYSTVKKAEFTELDTDGLRKTRTHIQTKVARLQDTVCAADAAAQDELENAIQKVASVLLRNDLPSKDCIMQMAKVAAGEPGRAIVEYTCKAYHSVEKNLGLSKKAGYLGAEHPLYSVIKEAKQVLVKYRDQIRKSATALQKCSSVMHGIEDGPRQQAFGTELENIFRDRPGLKKKAPITA